MLIRLSLKNVRRGVPLGLAAVLVSSFAIAGEKIRTSDAPTTSTTPSPSRNFREDASSPFDFSRSSGPGGGDFSAPLPAANPKVRDAKIEQLLDQKKNWIFNAPSQFDRDASAREILSVRESDFDSATGQKKTKSAIERYFERDSASQLTGQGLNKNSGGAFGGSADSGGLDGKERDSRLPFQRENRSSLKSDTGFVSHSMVQPGGVYGDSLTKDTGSLGDGLIPADLGSRDVFGLPSPKYGSGSSELSPQEKRMQEFQKILGVGVPAAGLAGATLNLQQSGANQAINPITSSGGLSSDLGPGLAGSTLESSRPGYRPGAASDIFGTRYSSGSSLSPSPIIPSASAPSLIQRPAVLEIPRRRF
jgi:hypothetical protein